MSVMHVFRRAVLASALGWGGPLVLADVIRVPEDYPTIQAGMDAAQAGDTVLVADGTYTGPGNKNLFYAGVPLTLRSENGPQSCIIDCEGVGVAFFLVADEPPDFIIDGFTIRNGNGRPGGAFFIHHDCRATIRNCVITQCTSSDGGAILCENSSSPTLINCVITGNTAINGGGLFIWDDSSPTLINCVITNNIADANGGGVYFNTFGTIARFINCTITDNLGKQSGGGVFVAGGNSVIVNSIIWQNTGEQITDNSGTLTVRYSDVEGGWPGTGNIDDDPLFVDPTNGDYHIQASSPVIDAADNTAVPASITNDLDGNPRFVDDPDTVDIGNGTPPIVDMGPYEFQPDTSVPATPTDVTRTLGIYVSGGVPELLSSDDTYYVLQSGPGFNPAEPHPARADVGFDTGGASASTLDITLEEKANIGGPTAVLLLRNWNASQWDELDRYALSPVDQTFTFPGVPAADYMNGSNRIVVRVRTFAILVLDPAIRGIFSHDFLGVEMHE